MIVVLVLIMSCQVSENLKSGPDKIQTRMINSATIKAQGVPIIREKCVATLWKWSETLELFIVKVNVLPLFFCVKSLTVW